MTTLVSFPSRYIRIEYIVLLVDQRRLRTINDHGDLVVDGLYVVINAGHLIEYLIRDTSYFIIDSMRCIQNLCSYHPDFFIRQLIQPLQRIFNVSLSNQLLEEFF